MARTNAISLIESGQLAAELSELYGYVIDNVMKNTLSSTLKSQAYTGNPAAGSVEFRRFANAIAKNYGTARAAGAGDKITVPHVTVNLNQHKEIVEEVAGFDIESFGVGNIIARRVDNHAKVLEANLDTAFFADAVSEGTAATLTAETVADKIEEAIQLVENTKNDFVTGVPRNLINVVLSPSAYGQCRNEIDKAFNPNIDTAAEEIGTFHGVRVYSSVYLPDGTDGIVIADESIALPVITTPYTAPEKIQLSNDYAVSLFYDYGVKALTPDLIYTFTL